MDARLCLLVIVGTDDTGRKEVLAVIDGYREREANVLEVIAHGEPGADAPAQAGDW